MQALVKILPGRRGLAAFEITEPVIVRGYTLGAAAFSHVQACFAASRPMMEAAVAAADLDTLAAIDLETGWPS